MQLSKSKSNFLFCLSVISNWLAELKLASPFKILIFLEEANFLIPEFNSDMVLSFQSWFFLISICNLSKVIPAFFTSSTSFANPAVTIARILTDTFTGIAPISVKYFISGQIVGCLFANYIFNKFEN